MILILGAGLAGLSASYHLGHDRCLLLEKQGNAFGHIAMEQREGFVWDTGPHVSFTKHAYVRELFSDGVDGAFHEIEARVGNHYQGCWIDHPAQTSMVQIPEPERSQCLASFREQRRTGAATPPDSYQAWLEQAFGAAFADRFPGVYTRKYWTVAPAALTTDWVGSRVHYPTEEEVERGARQRSDRSLHYITKVRYPRQGGYQSFARKLWQGSRVRHGAEALRIDLAAREVVTAGGERFGFEQLLNTLPLPVFLGLCKNVPQPVLDAAAQLLCTQLLLVNIAVPHPALRPEHWIYVYDQDKLSTRINFTEKLSAANAPPGWSGIQTEVYFSRHRPLPATPEEVGQIVEDELRQMGLIDIGQFAAGMSSHRHVRLVPWANVAFNHATAPALEVIWQWLATHGLEREADDVHPLTDWSSARVATPWSSPVAMAGRFGQWKYFWSDDCVMRGRQLAGAELAKQ